LAVDVNVVADISCGAVIPFIILKNPQLNKLNSTAIDSIYID